MKKILPFLLALLLATAISCKKDHVDATDLKTFQSSINDMTSGLNTLQQIKFNEALYILKTFGVDAEGDRNELNALRELLRDKKVPEIFSLADQVAAQNGIDWTSTGAPSLGDMNIFEDIEAKESDPNDIKAKSLDIIINPGETDPTLGVKSLQIVPKLLDNSNKPVIFDGATLETTLEVFSNGSRLWSSKNLMLDNQFKGFNLKFNNLPADKILDNKVDITVSVKTTEKTFKLTKVGVLVNENFLRQPVVVSPDQNIENDSLSQDDDIDFNGNPNQENPTNTTTATNTNVSGNPKTTVQKFLNSLSTQNLKAAYETSSNPNWGSYENFSNANSGFGAVKKVNVKNISSPNVNNDKANVSATYDVVDKNGKTTSLNVTFGLKNINGEWKIASYKIN